MQAAFLSKLKSALSHKLQEFDDKSKTLATENQKFEQGKVNMLSSLTSNMNFKKNIQSKLETARQRLEQTQHDQLALQRQYEDTEANLQKVQQELERVEKEKNFIDNVSNQVIEKKNQEYGQRLKAKDELESDARDEIKRLQQQIEKEKQRLRELQDQYDRGKLELDGIERQIKLKEEEAKNQDDLNDLDKQKALLQAKNQQLKNDIAKAQQELDSLKDKNASLQGQIDKQIKDNQNAELEVENAKRQAAQRDDVEKQIEEQQKARDALKDKVKDLQKQLDELDKAIKQKVLENAALQSQIEVLMLFVAYEREIKRVVGDLQNLESKLLDFNLQYEQQTRQLNSIQSQLQFHQRESYFELAYDQLTKVDLIQLKKSINHLQSDFDKFKRQIFEIINDKLTDKEIDTNSDALKKDVKAHIATLQNIAEQITQITGQDMVEVDGLIDRVKGTLSAEEIKAKEKMLHSVQVDNEEEQTKIQALVNQVKNSQRDRAKLERLIKLKMECIKETGKKEKIFKLMLKLSEVNEHLLATKFFQNERDSQSLIQSTAKSFTTKTDLSKILTLLEEYDYFVFQLKQAQSDIKDFEFQLLTVKQLYEDLDSSFAVQKTQDLYDRMRQLNVNSHQNELNDIADQVNGWRQQVQDFRQGRATSTRSVGKHQIELIDLFDKECELALDVVTKNQRDFQRVHQNLESITQQLNKGDQQQVAASPESQEIDEVEVTDKLSELAKIEFSLEKLEDRYRDGHKYFENQVKRSFKGAQLKWIDIEDAVKL
ncbi:UNKNOWN [Stylonychia lemnae]|uniref:Uncharacterized protein n=1 Tax=Stylonychia lemnae TaxID=5949 RepID=A0A078AZW2_STYLE|nr:UNKNOWN [Stylonychia lemnae]|eukprot:CDW87631.1 UNKNOWN [Stylonychia lemnae]